MYRVSEQDINATVNDFTVFCDFVEEKKPVLSKRRGELGKNDLFCFFIFICSNPLL